MERLGEEVRIYPSHEYNLKITTPEDLALAGKLVESGEIRIGWGEDRHSLKKGRPLYLGGVRIPSPWGAVGHSDGDVILHAVTDALLGALGLGDIGEHFPNTNARFRGVRSESFLKKVLSLVSKNHFELLNIDTTVVLEKPKLGFAKKRIQKKVASLAGPEIDRVGVKAKTAEGLGPEGRGEAIQAHAIVTLRSKA